MEYKLYKKSVIKALNEPLQDDEFDDDAKAVGSLYEISDAYAGFMERNVKCGAVLDLGCGSGRSFARFHFITHGLDCNPGRASAAQAKTDKVEVGVGVAEALPYDTGSLTTVLFMQGFFQVRSDYEALYEINRVLCMNGRFIFDLPNPARADIIVFGRIIEPRSYCRIMLADFGFEVVERRSIDNWYEAIAVEKIADFDARRLRKIQVVPVEGGLCRVNNYDATNWKLK